MWGIAGGKVMTERKFRARVEITMRAIALAAFGLMLAAPALPAGPCTTDSESGVQTCHSLVTGKT